MIVDGIYRTIKNKYVYQFQPIRIPLETSYRLLAELGAFMGMPLVSSLPSFPTEKVLLLMVL